MISNPKTVNNSCNKQANISLKTLHLLFTDSEVQPYEFHYVFRPNETHTLIKTVEVAITEATRTLNKHNTLSDTWIDLRLLVLYLHRAQP